MDDEDRSNLRDLHAGFAMLGLIMRGETSHTVASKAYLYADEMQEARDSHGAGIVSVKRRTKKEKAYE
tara:strand:- start:559 stop:762 length:204 start_codon:yes stop_codon:yes gene_type:complete